MRPPAPESIPRLPSSGRRELDFDRARMGSASGSPPTLGGGRTEGGLGSLEKVRRRDPRAGGLS